MKSRERQTVRCKNEEYDIIVVGAGPAGLSAAKIAADAGRRVLVLERNVKPAKKIHATGNGRCNFLNRKAEDAESILKYCNSIGIHEAEEEDGRLYPRSRRASSVAAAICKSALAAGAELRTNIAVKQVRKNEQGFELESDSGECFLAGRLIIACGGKAGIQYGCAGDGYKWAQNFGHSLIKPIPALTGLECAEDISELQGIRVYAKASLLGDGAELASDTGEVQFAKNSISGICVMNLSRYFRVENAENFTLRLDLYPEYSELELSTLFLKQEKVLGNAMEGLIPEKMYEYIYGRMGPGKQNAEALAVFSKAFGFTITGSRGWKDAQVTSGGVDLSELDEDFQSKLVPGLWFAGEILDYDGPCGGYNLAWAFKSGIKAGKAASR
jgi:predicted Rossmann fold flavoprotein